MAPYLTMSLPGDVDLTLDLGLDDKLVLSVFDGAWTPGEQDDDPPEPIVTLLLDQSQALQLCQALLTLAWQAGGPSPQPLRIPLAPGFTSGQHRADLDD